MPVKNNPTPNQDVPPQRTPMIPIAIALAIALIIGVIGYSYFSSGDIETTNSFNRENNSLTDPMTDSSYDKNERQDATDRNLSSPSTNNIESTNKPFDGNDKNKSSSQAIPN
ncbi:hypothetical protein [Nitrosomonas ureae]|uniref:Uncharacterized protein n=1 Tax=Nitrosomonas ureae TaxID=44577 RepID=A0A286A8E6_9PROT|nr:hypothetical protein [Nitrosomonas ureae]SOD18193.1 hypothetical protein SAMN06297164_1542 [Nitrosomonas ureae]